jgi:hypothetical protein
METLTPGAGLLVWQIVLPLAFVLWMAAWIMILLTRRLQAADKIVWLIGTLALPIIGPLIFLYRYSSFRK